MLHDGCPTANGIPVAPAPGAPAPVGDDTFRPRRHHWFTGRGHASPARRWALPVDPIDDPHRLRIVPAGVEVVGVALVTAAPHRTPKEAAALAARVAVRPSTYLPLLLWLGVVGVRDLRVTFGKEAARA